MKRFICAALASPMIMMGATACGGGMSAGAPAAGGSPGAHVSASPVASAGAPPEAGQTASPAPKQTIAVINSFSEQNKRDAFQQWCDKVALDHPNYTFQISYAADDNQYRTLIRTKYSSGSPIDIMSGVPRDFPDMVTAGMLQDLTNAPFIGNIEPLYLKGASGASGAIYGVPIDLGLTLVFYNKDIYSRNSLAVPATYKDFLANCAALRAKGVNPLAMGFKDGWAAGEDFMAECCLILNKNPNFFKDVDGGVKKFADYPELKNAMRRSADRFNTSAGSPFAVGNNAAVQDFATGKAAMFLTDTRNIAAIRGLNPDGRFGVFALPADAAADTAARLYVDDSWMIANGTKNMNAVIDLFNYATSSEGSANWSKRTGGIPTVKGVTLHNPDAMTSEAIAVKNSGRVIFTDAQYLPAGRAFDVFFGKFSSDFLKNQGDGIDANIDRLDREYAQALDPANPAG